MRHFSQMMTKYQVMTPKRRFAPRLVSRVVNALRRRCLACAEWMQFARARMVIDKIPEYGILNETARNVSLLAGSQTQRAALCRRGTVVPYETPAVC
jgi:ABC-type antimicrobial peptide transport system ATPase subunit